MTTTLEERVAYLEGRAEEQSRLGAELREMIAHLDQKVDRFRGELSAQIQALDQKMTQYFTWLIGLYVAGLLAIMAALLGR
jgi:uncharacterized coiled-coil protein SlyX